MPKLTSSGIRCDYKHSADSAPCNGAGHVRRHHFDTPGARPKPAGKGDKGGGKSSKGGNRSKGDGKRGGKGTLLDMTTSHVDPYEAARLESEQMLARLAVMTDGPSKDETVQLDFGRGPASSAAGLSVVMPFFRASIFKSCRFVCKFVTLIFWRIICSNYIMTLVFRVLYRGNLLGRCA